MNALKERIRQGAVLSNGMTVEYPHGLSYNLMRLLDQLRLVQARVRIEIADPSDPDTNPSIWDGHLRRVAGAEEFCAATDNSLGLFLSPTSVEPLWSFGDDDYASLLSIVCIDELLLGNTQPMTLWAAPQKSDEQLKGERAHRERRARWTAVLFVLHIALIFAVVIGLAVPFMHAASSREWVGSILWCAIWWTASVATCVIFGELWDGPWPRFHHLWRTSQRSVHVLGKR